MQPITIEKALSKSSHILQPMGIGHLIDQAFFFYRMNFISLTAYMALFTVPLTILTAIVSIGLIFLTSPDLIDRNPHLFGFSSIFSSMLNLLISLLSFLLLPLQIAGIGAALHVFLFEKRLLSLGEMLKTVRQKLVPLLLLGILGIIFFFPLLFTFLIPPVGLAVLTLYTFTFFLSPYVIIYEGRGDLTALQRSWNLLRHSIWRLLGYLLLFLSFSILLGIIIGSLILTLATGMTTLIENPLIATLAQTLASSLSSIFFAPIQYSVAGFLYFDLRVRHEGLDIALRLAEAAGQEFDLTIVPISEEPLLNQQTLKAIGLLSFAYTAVVGIFCGCWFLLIFTIASI